MCMLALGACSMDLNEGQVRIGAPSEKGFSPVTPQVFSEENGAVIKPGEDFQITLISAYICDFRESVYLDFLAPTNRGAVPCRDDGNAEADTRGEISILAGFGFRDGTLDGGTPAERLVYYGDDVRETGQLLNFLNLPIYGPAPYSLAASHLRVTILELDQEEAEEQSAFLETLANAGASYSSPVEGKVIEVLGSIGDALIKSNKDDRELRFDMGFDVPFLSDDGDVLDADAEPTTQIMRLPLREGYLAVVRRERRSDRDHFKDVKICPTLGLIVPVKNEAGQETTCNGEDFLQQATWLLLRVTREHSSVVDASLNRTLRDALSARKGGGLESADLSRINSALEALQTADE